MKKSSHNAGNADGLREHTGYALIDAHSSTLDDQIIERLNYLLKKAEYELKTEESEAKPEISLEVTLSENAKKNLEALCHKYSALLKKKHRLHRTRNIQR